MGIFEFYIEIKFFRFNICLIQAFQLIQYFCKLLNSLWFCKENLFGSLLNIKFMKGLLQRKIATFF